MAEATRGEREWHEVHAYLSGLGLGGLMRIRDHLARGRVEAALAESREMIVIYLQWAVPDANKAWINYMTDGPAPPLPADRHDWLPQL